MARIARAIQVLSLLLVALTLGQLPATPGVAFADQLAQGRCAITTRRYTGRDNASVVLETALTR
jgi:hypothetical protein